MEEEAPELPASELKTVFENKGLLRKTSSSLSNCSERSSSSSTTPSEPSSPAEAFRDIKLRKSCGEILLSRYLKVLSLVAVLPQPILHYVCLDLYGFDFTFWEHGTGSA